MTEERTGNITCSWNRHRVFYYALAARLLLSFRFLPPAWLAYFYENSAIRSIVSNPWWTFSFAREILADKAWGENDEISLASKFLSLLVVERNDAATWFPMEYVSISALLLIDYWIAHLLSEIVYRFKTPDSELALVDRMPTIIRPDTAILSALSSPALRSAVLPLLYFANPAVILSSSVYGCFSNIKLLCLLIAICHVEQFSAASCVTSVALAIAMCLDVSFGVFGIALPGVWDQMLLVYSVLQALSVVFTGNLQIHGLPTAGVTSLPPSLSVLWYTHMEFFTRFAPYLRLLLGYLPYIVFVPLSIRLHRYPMVLVAIFWIIVHTLCQPVSTLTDFFVGIVLMLLSPASCARMNQAVVMIAVVGAGVPVTLYLVLHPLWLVSNAGEANFIYFQCLAFQIFVANVGLQFVTASLQRDKALRLTEKEGGISTSHSTNGSPEE
mmetsp:Transcript_10606/g.20435  ORF Transcript_10606/g.20435 Transcript_10606/m.20435 type:complete len:441 (+) Transcript_10606:57-1379(+)